MHAGSNLFRKSEQPQLQSPKQTRTRILSLVQWHLRSFTLPNLPSLQMYYIYHISFHFPPPKYFLLLFRSFFIRHPPSEAATLLLSLSLPLTLAHTHPQKKKQQHCWPLYVSLARWQLGRGCRRGERGRTTKDASDVGVPLPQKSTPGWGCTAITGCPSTATTTRSSRLSAKRPAGSSKKTAQLTARSIQYAHFYSAFLIELNRYQIHVHQQQQSKREEETSSRGYFCNWIEIATDWVCISFS